MREIINGAGTTVLDAVTYDAYGNITGQTNSVYLGNFGYTNLYYDPITGLYFAGARVYDPNIAQWLTVDPLGLAGGLSNFRDYVGNNTTNAKDLSGLQPNIGYVLNDNGKPIPFDMNDPGSAAMMRSMTRHQNRNFAAEFRANYLKLGVMFAEPIVDTTIRVGWDMPRLPLYALDPESQPLDKTWRDYLNHQVSYFQMMQTTTVDLAQTGMTLSPYIVRGFSPRSVFAEVPTVRTMQNGRVVDSIGNPFYAELASGETAGQSQFSIGRANSSDLAHLRDLEAYGTAIANNPTAARLHQNLIELGYQHKLDFGPVIELDGGFVVFGQETRMPPEVTVFALAHSDVDAMVGTFGHEARHAVDAFRGMTRNTRWSEFRAHLQEFTVRNGRIPTATEAQVIAMQVVQNYSHLAADNMDFLLRRVAGTGHGHGY